MRKVGGDTARAESDQRDIAEHIALHSVYEVGGKRRKERMFGVLAGHPSA